MHTETQASFSATVESGQDQQVSCTWSVLSQNEITSAGASNLVLETGRDPRVLSVSPFPLGVAGSSYMFQLSAEVDGISTTVNATGEIHETLVCDPRTGTLFGRGGLGCISV